LAELEKVESCDVGENKIIPDQSFAAKQ